MLAYPSQLCRLDVVHATFGVSLGPPVQYNGQALRLGKYCSSQSNDGSREYDHLNSKGMTTVQTVLSHVPLIINRPLHLSNLRAHLHHIIALNGSSPTRD